MSQTIWKYELDISPTQTIEIPAWAEILCIQIQNESPCIWALVQPINTPIQRTFEIFPTGAEIPKGIDRKYIGTFQIHGGLLVYHCFEFIRFL